MRRRSAGRPMEFPSGGPKSKDWPARGFAGQQRTLLEMKRQRLEAKKTVRVLFRVLLLQKEKKIKRKQPPRGER